MNTLHRIVCMVLLLVLFAMLGTVPGKILSGDTLSIDTTMPSSIPAEIIADWRIKDNITTTDDYSAAITKIKNAIPAEFASKIDTGSTEAAYLKACHWRRMSRIKPWETQIRKILYTRHHDLGGPFIGFLAEINSTYSPGGALLMLTMQDFYPKPKIVLEDKTGCIRDPCVSLDVKKAIFAWSKDNNGYHIYEIALNNQNSIRQLTNDTLGLTVSDFEPCYLPDSDIVFNSTRCFGLVPAHNDITCNLFLMNKDGQYLRRIGYDMAQTFCPTLTEQGKIFYSRWEFNDRNKMNCCGIFEMNPDGTYQSEFFGNQLSWPNTFLSVSWIHWGTGKCISIIGKYQGPVYQGDLVLINPAKGRNNVNAIQLIAPKRPIPIDPNPLNGISDEDRHFQSPFALNENWFLISYRENSPDKFKIYLMNIDGERELLAWDTTQSVSQPIPIYGWNAAVVPRFADYHKTTSEVFITNAYYGTGTGTSVAKSSIKKIRIIALDLRTDSAFGSTGTSCISLTPVARNGGSWNAKRILGEMKVETDGSAAFHVPTRTPFYVQLIDSNGCMIQSRRSWRTSTPGETISISFYYRQNRCYGCHEDKNVTPPYIPNPIANQAKALQDFFGKKNTYFHYPEIIQPILDKNCVSCHKPRHSSGLDLSGEKIWTGDLLDADNKNANRFWCKSYLNLTDTAKKLVNYIDIYSPAEGLKPNTVGSGQSVLIAKLKAKAGEMKDVSLTEEEMATLCAWIDLGIPHGGKYNDDMTAEDSMKYEMRLKRRLDHEAIEIVNGAEQKYFPNKSGCFFSAKISIAHNRLNIKLPSEGTILLVDLRGRRVLSVNISRVDFLKSAERSFPLRVPAGLYILKFKGRTSSTERVVPVL